MISLNSLGSVSHSRHHLSFIHNNVSLRSELSRGFDKVAFLINEQKPALSSVVDEIVNITLRFMAGISIVTDQC